MIKLIIDRQDIAGIIENGIKLHGHAGPYLNLGIRMGLLALDLLDAKGYFDLSVIVELKNRTPFSCLIDGLQISTGCTMGKGNIQVRENPDFIRAFFKTDEQSLLIQLKSEISEMIHFEKENCEDLGEKILQISDSELFDYEK